MACRDDLRGSHAEDGTGPNAGAPNAGGGLYEIHVRGQLDSHWSDWLEGLEVRYLDDGEMILSGTIVDQAALLGILNKVNRLNLILLSVLEIRTKEATHAG